MIPKRNEDCHAMMRLPRVTNLELSTTNESLGSPLEITNKHTSPYPFAQILLHVYLKPLLNIWVFPMSECRVRAPSIKEEYRMAANRLPDSYLTTK
jgi:hypothetical protein